MESFWNRVAIFFGSRVVDSARISGDGRAFSHCHPHFGSDHVAIFGSRVVDSARISGDGRAFSHCHPHFGSDHVAIFGSRVVDSAHISGDGWAFSHADFHFGSRVASCTLLLLWIKGFSLGSVWDQFRISFVLCVVCVLSFLIFRVLNIVICHVARNHAAGNLVVQACGRISRFSYWLFNDGIML